MPRPAAKKPDGMLRKAPLPAGYLIHPVNDEQKGSLIHFAYQILRQGQSGKWIQRIRQQRNLAEHYRQKLSGILTYNQN
jgi:hypothetical protein